jgi:hypothetical protein
MSGRFTVKVTADGGNCLFRSFALPLKARKINTFYNALKQIATGYEYVGEHCDLSVNL